MVTAGWADMVQHSNRTLAHPETQTKHARTCCRTTGLSQRGNGLDHAGQAFTEGRDGSKWSHGFESTWERRRGPARRPMHKRARARDRSRAVSYPARFWSAHLSGPHRAWVDPTRGTDGVILRVLVSGMKDCCGFHGQASQIIPIVVGLPGSHLKHFGPGEGALIWGSTSQPERWLGGNARVSGWHRPTAGGASCFQASGLFARQCGPTGEGQARARDVQSRRGRKGHVGRPYQRRAPVDRGQFGVQFLRRLPDGWE